MESEADNPSFAEHRQLGPTDFDLEDSLLRDIKRLVSLGPAGLSDPAAIPMLAELALAPDGDPLTCGKAVVATLRQALSRLGRFDDKFSGREVGKALAELIGIGRGVWANQNDRFDNAASELWAYTSGQSLRRTKRMGNAGEIKYVWEVFLDLLVAELLTLARESNFMPTGRFIREPKNRPLTSRMTLMDLSTMVSYIGKMEVSGFLFGPAFDDRFLQSCCPVLISLAETAYPSYGTTIEKIEALLTWAISVVAGQSPHDEVTRRRYIAFIIEFVGLGKSRDDGLEDRMRRAMPYIPDHLAERGWDEKGELLRSTIPEGLAPILCQFALDEGVSLEREF